MEDYDHSIDALAYAFNTGKFMPPPEPKIPLKRDVVEMLQQLVAAVTEYEATAYKSAATQELSAVVTTAARARALLKTFEPHAAVGPEPAAGGQGRRLGHLSVDPRSYLPSTPPSPRRRPR